jgi:NADP-dependent 3-hydroxy acid dehydrogenase YdfG
MNTFTNKVAVVTGGKSGIRLATAKEFSRRGAKVVISGRDEKTLAKAAASIGGDAHDGRKVENELTWPNPA